MATAQELVSASNCLDCGISDGQKLSVLIYLFAQSAGVSMTAQELVSASACYNCGISPGQQLAVLIYLADQIVQGGGGGGGGTTIQFLAASDPVGVPTGNARLAFRLDNGKMFVYNSGTGNWDPYLA